MESKSYKAFKPLELNKVNESFYTQIVDYWREMIVTGVLRPGDFLPSERELAEMFDVSRVPIREALKVLEYLGFVKQIRGKGVVVQKADPQTLFMTIGPMLTATYETLEELFDIRILLEPYAAKQAAQKASKEDMDRMAEHIQHMEWGIQNNVNVEETSFAFHTEIIKASGNQILLMITYYIAELQRQSRHRTLWSHQHREEAYKFHHEIYKKIQERDGDGAHKLMYEHLLNAKAFMLKQQNLQ